MYCFPECLKNIFGFNKCRTQNRGLISVCLMLFGYIRVFSLKFSFYNFLFAANSTKNIETDAFLHNLQHFGPSSKEIQDQATL